MRDFYIFANGQNGRKLIWSWRGLIEIARSSGQLQTCSTWLEGNTGYAMSIRKDTGKQLVTMVTEAKYVELGHRIDTQMYKNYGPTLLTVAAVRLNLETHFEHEIKIATEAIIKCS